MDFLEFGMHVWNSILALTPIVHRIFGLEFCDFIDNSEFYKEEWGIDRNLFTLGQVGQITMVKLKYYF